jgi:hypothetical protein
VSSLPVDCTAVPADFDPRTVSGPGRCLYRPLVGISERDQRYDRFINSQANRLWKINIVFRTVLRCRIRTEQHNFQRWSRNRITILKFFICTIQYRSLYKRRRCSNNLPFRSRSHIDMMRLRNTV